MATPPPLPPGYGSPRTAPPAPGRASVVPLEISPEARELNRGIAFFLGAVGGVCLAACLLGVVLYWLFDPYGGVVTNAITARPVASSWLALKAEIGPIRLLTDPQHRAPVLPAYVAPYATPGEKCPFADNAVAKSWARFYTTGIADGIWVRSDFNLRSTLESVNLRTASPQILYVDSQMGRFQWALAQIEKDGSGYCAKDGGPGSLAYPFTTLRDRDRPYNAASARAAVGVLIRDDEFSYEKPRGKSVRRPTPEEAQFILSIWRQGRINFPRRVLYEIHDQDYATLWVRKLARYKHETFGLPFNQKTEDLISFELALRMHEILTETTPQEIEQLRAEGVAYILNN